MSSLPNNLPQFASAPSQGQDSDWIRLDIAAERLGCTVRQARRRAAQLAGRGLARRISPPGGGPATWHLHQAADARLAEAVPRYTGDLEPYTQRQRAAACARAEAVAALRAARATDPRPVGRWIEDLVADLAGRLPIKVSRATLYKWDKAAGSPIDLANLVDTRGGDQKSRGDRRVWDYFTDCYLDDNQPAKRVCWERARDYAKDQGLTWCSYRSLLRQLDDRVPLATQVYHRDPRRWRSEFAPFSEQDSERFDAGQCWVGDNRPMDLLCRITSPEGGVRIFRPQLTLWLDWRTRRVVGWALSDLPDSSTILAALRMGLLDEANKGGPAQVWIDNGRDFACYSLHGETKQMRTRRRKLDLDNPATGGLFGRLGIEPHFSLKFNPQGKARCERIFATIGARFDKTFATYTGKNTVDKPEKLEAVIKAAKTIPSFEHVRRRMGQWIDGYNARTEHQMHDLAGPDGRLSPDQAMDHWNTTHRLRPADEVLDAMLQHHHKPVRVGRNGFTLRIAGQPMHYGQAQLAGELRRWQGTKREIFVTYDPADLRTVRVHDDQWRLICQATANMIGPRHSDPLRVEHVKQAARIKAANKRAHQQMRQSREAEYLSTEEIAADAAAAESDAASQPPVRADGLKLVPNAQPMHRPDESDDDQAQPAAKVAGAEHDDLPSIYDDLPDDWSAGLYPRDELDDGPSIYDFAADMDVQADDSRSILEDL